MLPGLRNITPAVSTPSTNSAPSLRGVPSDEPSPAFSWARTPEPPRSAPSTSYSTPAYLEHDTLPSTAEDQVFSLLHMRLLFHFKTTMLEDFTMSDPNVTAFVDMAIQLALQTPYVMDQLLALSAAHMSTKHNGEGAIVYQREATRLQTRGLSSYNATDTSMSEENCLPVFLYSTLLVQHVLFDAFSVREDPTTFMDRLAGSFKLCAGVRAVAGQGWPSIQKQFLDQTGRSAAGEWNGNEIGEGTVPEVSRLHDLIKDAGLNEQSFHACSEAVSLLEKFVHPRDMLEAASFRRANSVLQWPVRLSSDFVDMILQRRPEALVILGFFAVMVHDAREYWAFGNAGKFMLHAVRTHLGSYWDDWLAWPTHMIDRSSN